MKKTIGVILLLGVAGLLAAVSVAHSASTDGTLQANVGPGFSITLTQNGARVTHLDPGTYTIDVDDQSAEHDFDLTGPGVSQATDIAGTGTTTWTVTFQDGTYTYVCDAHVATMHGSFTVGAVSTPTAPAALALKIVSAKVVKPKTVRLSVTASRSAALAATLWKGTTKVAQAKGERHDGDDQPRREDRPEEGRLHRQSRLGLGVGEQGRHRPVARTGV